MKSENTFLRQLVALVFTTVLGLTSSFAVYAGLIHDLTVTDPFSDPGFFIGTGQIVFKTDSGNDVSDVESFTFTAMSPVVGSDDTTTFGLADIDTIAWIIDDEWNLTLSNLLTFLIPGTLANTRYSIGLSTTTGTNVGSQEFCADAANYYCKVDDDIGLYDTRINRDLTSSAVHVPEPTTLALLSLGLAGLGFTRRRTKE